MLASPILEKLPYIYETETTELTDIDSDNEVEEENIELENKILSVVRVAFQKPHQKNDYIDFLHHQNFTNNFSREIHTPPPELI